MKTFSLKTILTITCLVSVAFAARAQNVSIDWSTIDGGGGTSTGGVYSVSGTIGQPDAGEMSGGNFTVDGGLWGIIAALQTPGAPVLSIVAADDITYPQRRPSSVIAAGSDDGTNFTTLAVAAPAAPFANTQLQEFSVLTNNTSWARYRITFGPPVSGHRLQVGELHEHRVLARFARGKIRQQRRAVVAGLGDEFRTATELGPGQRERDQRDQFHQRGERNESSDGVARRWRAQFLPAQVSHSSLNRVLTTTLQQILAQAAFSAASFRLRVTRRLRTVRPVIPSAKTLFSIACLLFLPAVLATDPPKIVRSGWYPWDPYQYTVVKHDLTQLTGLDVQLVRAAFQRLGYEVVCDEVSWAQHQRDVQNGVRDIAAGAFQNAERAEYAYYSAPYRTETDVLYVRKRDAGRWRFQNAGELLQQWRTQPVKLGIIDGFYYGPAMMAYVNDPANASRIIRVGNDVANFENLLAGKIDGFVIDRLVGATLAWRNEWQTEVVEISPPVYAEAIHVIFSKKTTTPELVAAFNKSMTALRQSGQYNRIVREYLLPVLLGVTVGQRWFFIVDIIGTIAFAVSGVLLARQGRYSLFGAFVLASLPAVGGGLMRDIIVNRETPAVLRTPAYLFTILVTVLVCYALFRIKPRPAEETTGDTTIRLNEQKLVGRITNNMAVAFFDALGLAAFTVVGVIVAVEARCQPLWLWGPLLGAFTGAGGGILRDVIRADADNPGLKGAFYAEVALIWGLIFSLFLLWFANSLDYQPAHITLAVTVTIIGGLVTRMAVFHFKIKSPMY